jgi:trans-aconitate 2-methyltransferase
VTWDPKHYLMFADERTRPAAELVGRVAVASPQRVIDLGCGPGNSTAIIAARWPDAEIEGLDSSAEMIESARASDLRAKFFVGDLATWQPASPYDVIFSNATIQWLPDHEHLLPRLMAYVAPGGAFAFQVPHNQDAPSHSLMRETAASGPWSAKLRNVREISVLSSDAYYGILAAPGRKLDIWETEYLHVLEGEDPVYRWVGATGLRPFVQALADDEPDLFTAAYRARLRVVYPRRSDGMTLFPFRRLFVVVKT